MKCINCGNENAPSYYSPKELVKYDIYFCARCLKLLMFQDLRYIQNQEEVKRLIKKKRKIDRGE